MVPFPPTSVHGGWAPAVNNISIFAQLPAPGQHRECNKNRRRFEGSTKAELRTFLAKKPTVARGCIGIFARNHGLTVAADVADWGRAGNFGQPGMRPGRRRTLRADRCRAWLARGAAALAAVCAGVAVA